MSVVQAGRAFVVEVERVATEIALAVLPSAFGFRLLSALLRGLLGGDRGHGFLSVSLVGSDDLSIYDSGRTV